MQMVRIAAAGALALGLAACSEGQGLGDYSDTQRGIAGAAAGAVISDATGGNALTGAVIGGAAGVFCDDAGVCKKRRPTYY